MRGSIIFRWFSLIWCTIPIWFMNIAAEERHLSTPPSPDRPAIWHSVLTWARMSPCVPLRSTQGMSQRQTSSARPCSSSPVTAWVTLTHLHLWPLTFPKIYSGVQKQKSFRIYIYKKRNKDLLWCKIKKQHLRFYTISRSLTNHVTLCTDYVRSSCFHQIMLENIIIVLHKPVELMQLKVYYHSKY